MGRKKRSCGKPWESVSDWGRLLISPCKQNRGNRGGRSAGESGGKKKGSADPLRGKKRVRDGRGEKTRFSGRTVARRKEEGGALKVSGGVKIGSHWGRSMLREVKEGGGVTNKEGEKSLGSFEDRAGGNLPVQAAMSREEDTKGGRRSY